MNPTEPFADEPGAKILQLVELRRELLTLEPSRRVTALVERPDVRRVVRRLCAQDLLVAIHACGVADSLELIELLPPEHIQRFVDLECWNRDRVDPWSLAAWLSVLFRASPTRALAQVMGLDAELITLFLKYYTRIFDLRQDEEPDLVPEHALITPDRNFLVTFVAPPNPAGGDQPDPTDQLGLETAQRIVEGLIARQPQTASRYLTGVRWELPSDLEESCYRWRGGRLADQGYCDFHSAQGIYAPIDLQRAPRREAWDFTPQEDEPDAALALYGAEVADAPFLVLALERLSPGARFGVQRQAIALANRVAASLLVPPGDQEQLVRCVRESKALANLGLEYWARGDAGRAADLLETCSLQQLFTTGHSLVVHLARRASRIAERLTTPTGTCLLTPATQEVFDELMQRAPARRLVPRATELFGHPPVATLAQLARYAELVAAEAFAAALLLDVAHGDLMEVERLVGAGTNMDQASELTLDVLLATILARLWIGGSLQLSPLHDGELATLRELMVQDRPVALEQRLTSALHPQLPMPGARDREALEVRVAELVGRLATALVEQVGAVSGPLDPRYITLLLCRVDDKSVRGARKRS